MLAGSFAARRSTLWDAHHPATSLSRWSHPAQDLRQPRLVVIPGYTKGVKTAISVPDETYDRVMQRAHDLGMSRSEFFSRAAARYLEELDSESVTAEIDQTVLGLTEPDKSAADAVIVAHRLLADAADEW